MQQRTRPTLPPINNGSIGAPHVVILGAGASIAAYQHWGQIGLPLPSMQNLIDVLNLASDIQERGYPINGVNFEAFYDDLATSGAHPDLRAKIERDVYNYFSALHLPSMPTLYDYLVLSLRGKDLIASFNWDPFLIQALRRNHAVGKDNLPKIIFLHGNVLTGVCDKDKVLGVNGHQCSVCREPLTPTQLLYPVRHKNYFGNPFIESQWHCLRYYLERAYFLTIFGYSAPKTDIEARGLMLEVWKNNPSLPLAEVEIIDIRLRQDIEEAWSEFFYSHHYMIGNDILNSYLFQHPRRSCDAFYSATMLSDPWHDNPFPVLEDLAQLRAWVAPLIAEEATRTPFSKSPLPPNG